MENNTEIETTPQYGILALLFAAVFSLVSGFVGGYFFGKKVQKKVTVISAPGTDKTVEKDVKVTETTHTTT